MEEGKASDMEQDGMTDNKLLERAVRTLAGRCDYAVTLDGQGFSAFDASFGHQLAEIPCEQWTGPQAHAVWRMIRKYRGQLATAGIDFDEIPEPDRTRKPKIDIPKSTLTVGDRGFEARWHHKDPKFWSLVNGVKRIGGAKFHDTGTEKFWTIPFRAETGQAIADFTSENGIEVAEDAALWIERLIAEQALKEHEREQIVEMATAEDADIVVEGLGPGCELLPFQRGGVAYAIRQKKTFIADQMGLGKTVEGIAVIIHEQAWPGVVVCPSSLKYNWLREFGIWAPQLKVQVFDNGHIDTDTDIVIVNYERLWEPKTGTDKVPLRLRSALAEFVSSGLKSVILDESHYCKNDKAKRSQSVMLLVDRVEIILLLTGTPVLNRPVELTNQLNIIGRLQEFGGFWAFAKRYCDAKHNGYGWDFGGASNLEELNDRLRGSCMVRRLKEDVLQELPAKRRATVPVEITNRRDYEYAEEDLLGHVAELARADVEFRASIEHLPEEEQVKQIRIRGQDAARSAERAETLVRIEALKQLAAKGKLKAVIDWVNDFLESGEKLVLFAHHREVQQALLDAFPNAARLVAADSPEDRQAQVDRFQTDESTRLIICSLKAGGVGVTLTAASDVAFVELGWTPGDHDQAEDRVHRIGQEDRVTVWYLLAYDTIDEENAELIESKREVVDATTDGDASRDQAGNIVVDLIAKMRERREARVA
jgi:SNF2 family DNA or RNA helicase